MTDGGRWSPPQWVRGAVVGGVVAVPVVALLGGQGSTGTSAPTAWAVLLPYGAVVGAVVAAAVPPGRAGVALPAAGGAVAGLVGWILAALTVAPLVRGEIPTWSVAAAEVVFPLLIAAVLHGALTGAGVHGWGVTVPVPAEATSGTSPAAGAVRVVVVGGGFAGLAAASRFERWARRRIPLDVTLVSEDNFLLFTPMLAEVASGAVEPSHITAPVRAAVPRTRYRQGRVDHVDTAGHTVRVVRDGSPQQVLPYDHLVVAAGSVPHVPGLPGVAEHAFTLKSLADAVALREHVLGALERADRSGDDPAARRRVLTVVVAGGGFAGAEAVAELFDLVHSVLPYYPGVRPEEPRFVLVHSRERILPELPAELGAFALTRLAARGIEMRLGVRVARAEPGCVVLDDGQVLEADTFVWTAGDRAAPLAEALPGMRSRSGALVTDPALRVVGLDRVWAIGDCAETADPDHPGETFPPTAQHAQREGKAVADNVVAVVQGREPATFRFRSFGALVALGHRTAAADIRGRLFSGVLAWLMWRGIYLVKLPGIERRVRVLLDWTLDGAFPRDIVVTTPTATRPARAER